MTTIINLYAGPGSGKSTSAAHMYAELKREGVNAELVREYVKDWAWDNRKLSTYDQIYVMGKQVRRESMLYGKVDFIVTDSPVLQGVYYAEKYSPPAVLNGVRSCVSAFLHQAAVDGHIHHHVFLTRSKPYQRAGRYETETAAREADVGIKAPLKRSVPTFLESGTTTSALGFTLATLTGRSLAHLAESVADGM